MTCLISESEYPLTLIVIQESRTLQAQHTLISIYYFIMDSTMQFLLEERARSASTLYSFLQRHNPLKESNYTGLWRLEDEDGTDTGITISKDSINIPPNTQPPIMIIWATEKNLENRAKEMEIQNYFPVNTTTQG